MGRGKVTVTVDLSDLKRLRDHPEELLRMLDMPCRDEVRRTLDVSAFQVPRGDPTDESNLAETAQVLGPILNLGEPLSTTWLGAYQHPAGGAIHEGFHWGVQTESPPPHWLKTSFRGARGRVRKAVALSVAEALRRFFPGK